MDEQKVDLKEKEVGFENWSMQATPAENL